MKNLLTLAAFVLLAFTTSSCALQMSNMPLSPQEEDVVKIISSVFAEHDIAVLQNWGTDRMIVGAKMGQVGGLMEAPHREHMEAEPGHDGHQHTEQHSKENIAIMVLKATPDPAGGYGQPTLNQNKTVFCYQELYIAVVENGTISFSKTLPVENSHLREEKPLEPSILQEIASLTGGTLQEGKILLP